MGNIPVPFVNKEYMNQMYYLGFLSSVMGASAGSMSLTAIGISPYISASIIMQLSCVIFKRLDELQRGLKDDRDRFDNLTIGLGIVLTVLQAFLTAAGFGRRGLLASYTWYTVLSAGLIWTFGSIIEILIGKFISDRYFGRQSGTGISLILCANILSSYPSDIMTVAWIIQSMDSGEKMIRTGVIWIVAVLAMIFIISYIHGCEIRLPVSFSTKIPADGTKAGVVLSEASNIPIRLTPGGVLPVIFSSSIISLPALLETFAGKSWKWTDYLDTSMWFDPGNIKYSVGAAVYILLIFGFSYYYADLELNPALLSDRIRKSGGMIEGVRPGVETEKLIRFHMKRTVFMGAAFLTLVAILPVIMARIYGVQNLSFLGTSIIITVDVILDTHSILSSGRIEKRYDRKLKAAGIFG